LKILRNGEQRDVSVVLAERKEDTETASAVPTKTPESVLGLMIRDLTKEVADQLKLKDTKGVLITKVEPDSLADRGGLKEGDVILEIDRRPIENGEDFRKASETMKTEDGVLFRLIREQRGLFLVLNDKE
jgi:serine protease Do